MREKKRLDISHFNSNNRDIEVESCYNFSTNGALGSDKGIDVAKFPLEGSEDYAIDLASLKLDGVDGLAYVKQYFPNERETIHRILVHAGDNKVYTHQLYSGFTGLLWLYQLEFDNPPITLSYKVEDRDAIVLTDKQKMLIWRSGYSTDTITGVPVITSMCMSDGVLFCTLEEPAFKIWYATGFDAYRIGQIDRNSGYISLEDDLGNARKILTFDENVYVFRDYGITKINFSKNITTFSQVYQSNTMIFSDTISAFGNTILFATKDGLYSFNGVNVKKLDIDILEKVDFMNSNLKSASLGNQYYLVARMNFNDGKQILCENGNYKNNVMIIINVEDMNYDLLRGMDINSIVAVRTEEFEKVLVTFNLNYTDNIGEVVNRSSLINTTLPQYWRSADVFTSPETKLINKLTLKASTGITCRLIYDGKELSFTTYCDGLNEFNFQAITKSMKIEIEASRLNIKVERLILDYYEY